MSNPHPDKRGHEKALFAGEDHLEMPAAYHRQAETALFAGEDHL